jgi:hypothetical protein
MKPQKSPADLADLRRQTTKPQNSLNLKQPVFLCVIMQLAAFLSASSALSAGEYSRKSTQSIHTQETPTSLPLIPQIYADKQQNSLNLKLTVFLCVIMQLAAFLCVLCVICGRIYIQTYSIYIAQMKPQKSPADLADLRRQTTNNKTTLTTICLSLRYNAACCIPLRPLRYLRENIHPNLLNQYTQMKPQKSPADLADLRRRNPKTQNHINLTNLSFSA